MEKMKSAKNNLYLKHKEEVDSHTEKMMRNIMGWEGENLGHLLKNKFGLEESEVPEEAKQDVVHFANYAMKQLALGGLESSVYQHEVERGEIKQAMVGASGSGFHDVLHAAFAYQRTGGQSVIPAYLEVADRALQDADSTSTQEELLVQVFEGVDSAFIGKLKETGDPLQAYIASGVRPEALDRYKEFLPRIEHLKDTAPMEYFFKAYEIYFVLSQPNASQNPHYIEEYMDSVEQRPNREGLRLFSMRYQSEASENGDKLWRLREFQQILEPLLARLRNNPQESTG